LDRDILRNIKLFIMDMDGTIYLGNSIFPFTLGFMSLLGQKNIDYIFFTNNASKSKADYIDKLENMSLHIHEDCILSSGDVTAGFLVGSRPGRSVYVVGTQSLINAFTGYGVKVVDKDPDIVVVSFDTALTYEKLDKACRYIRGGAEFLSTHCDINCPSEDGCVPDSGSICALISASTGKFPRYFGKPYPETVSMIERVTGCERSRMAIIGDRLYTDIKMGNINGITSILVLSGETGSKDLAASDIKPDLVYKDLSYLMKDLRDL
jgi:4-nitrophenyl phosphatase